MFKKYKTIYLLFIFILFILFPIKLHAAGTIIDTGGVKDQQDFSMQFIDPGNITYSCTDD